MFIEPNRLIVINNTKKIISKKQIFLDIAWEDMLG